MQFTETTSVLEFMQSIGATNLSIQQGEKKVPYVGFNDKGRTTCMLTKHISEVTASNVRDLQISWIDGITEEGKKINGYLLHRMGTPAEVLSTFSVTDVAVM